MYPPSKFHSLSNSPKYWGLTLFIIAEVLTLLIRYPIFQSMKTKKQKNVNSAKGLPMVAPPFRSFDPFVPPTENPASYGEDVFKIIFLR